MTIIPERFSIEDLKDSIANQVRSALNEDIGTGDITAQLIPTEKTVSAKVISREPGVFCGRLWVDEVFYQLDPGIQIEWIVDDGDLITPNQSLFILRGNARQVLTGERTALNFVQTLSGTATQTHAYTQAVLGMSVKILDTRKTLPGLRLAQKYAVLCGGGQNHRVGLYDAFLIKENHIASSGSIRAAVNTAKKISPSASIEVEVENFEELDEALNCKVDIVMLDNFSLEDTQKAVKIIDSRVLVEASGNMTLASLVDVAKTGVDLISIGALTKHCQALDLSLQVFQE